MPTFAVFTTAGVRKHDATHHPIMELMSMINQLFSVTYMTEPTMLFKLVAVSLDTTVHKLGTDKNLRTVIREIERLTHVFFVSKFNFIKFELAPRDLRQIPIDTALDYLLCFLSSPIPTDQEIAPNVQKTYYKHIQSLLSKSTGMNKSGFIMRIELYRAALDSEGRPMNLHEHMGIQYQVVKVQKATEVAANKTTYSFYFVGSTGEATLKVPAQKLLRGKQK